jgi:uncharacterized glyoxalase superfamily protein PhnB/SAM-dependent methyltransferase
LVIKDAASAIAFYKQAFGATELMRLADPGGKVRHAEIKIGDSPLMLADEFPEFPTMRSPQSLGGSPLHIYLYVEDVDALASQAIAAGAQVLMAVEDQPDGDRRGGLTDPFGHVWWLATHKEDVSSKEMPMAMRENSINPTDLPPAAALYQMATGYYFSRALYVAAKLGIADLLAQGPQHYGELARVTGTHAQSLRRVMRLLASAGVFAEQEDGSLALAPIGECLRKDVPGSLRSAALLFAGPLEWATWGDLLHSVQTGETALQHVFGMDSFTYFAQHPEEGAIFDEAMAAFSTQISTAVVAAYDFSQFGTLVDVGGGNGALLTGILRANPALRGVLFDLPRVAESAQRQLAAAGLTGRCTVIAGDFFEAVPGGGDAYILKHVIHDWDDARSIAILRNCHRAMTAQGRLLIVEGVYPARIDQSVTSCSAAANDVNMLVCTGGRQRAEAEFRALFEAGGFTLARIIPTQALSSVIEGVRR